MRWIFIFLIFLNLFFYIWQSQQVEENTPTNDYDTSYFDENIPSIKLLSEQSNNHEQPQKTFETKTLQEISHLLDDTSETLVTSTRFPLTCLYLGGVIHKEQLKIFIPYLTKIDTSITPIEIELKQSPKLHLYLYLTADSKAQQADFLAKLQAVQINTRLINKGHLKGHISLGNFVSIEDTLPLQKALQQMQLAFHIEDLQEAATSYWLKIPSNQQIHFTQKLLIKLAKELPTIQQELMLCNIENS